MNKIIFYLAVLISILLSVYSYFIVFEDLTEFQLFLYSLASIFFLVFGFYGLYAEMLWKKFRHKGIRENLCVEANYYVQKKGFFGRVFLFPFIKIKSSNSIIVSLLGAAAWVIIISILFKAIFG
ncbi:MAG: hypothetical protein K9H16_09970 [Bacteroidales bacterium]|nr:hypothetical protein [Bacteroidales bacterium]